MTGGERLQKFLARAGVASRRGAEAVIEAGRVTVNGVVVAQAGTKVAAGDTVAVDGVIVTPPTGHEYFVLNKPAGYVTTMDDPQGRATVAELFPETSRRLFSVGRLDRDTTGLLLLTDDGELAHRLMHPRFHVSKTYLAEVDGVPDETDLRALANGVTLDDGPTKPATVELLAEGAGVATVRLTIAEGRKRQVRRMLSCVGHPVRELTRIAFGPVVLGTLAEGTTRPLSAEEVAALRDAAGLAGEGGA
ncbi:MAG: pseudouridine synthase [Coriobacteriia bacterium]